MTKNSNQGGGGPALTLKASYIHLRITGDPPFECMQKNYLHTSRISGGLGARTSWDSHYSQEIIEAVWFAGQATVVLLLSTTSTCSTPSRKNLLDCAWARAIVCSQREPVFLSITLWHATTRYFLFWLFLVIFICKFGETCAILLFFNIMSYKNQHFCGKKAFSLFYSLLLCFSFQKIITCPHKLSSSLLLWSIIVGKVQICAKSALFRKFSMPVWCSPRRRGARLAQLFTDNESEITATNI